MEDIFSTWRTFKWGFDGNESQTKTPSQPCDSHAFPPWPSYNQEAAKHCSNKLKRMLAYQSNKGLLHWYHAQMWSINWTNLAMRYIEETGCLHYREISCKVIRCASFNLFFPWRRETFVCQFAVPCPHGPSWSRSFSLPPVGAGGGWYDAWYFQNNTKSGEARVIPGPESTLVFLQSIASLRTCFLLESAFASSYVTLPSKKIWPQRQNYTYLLNFICQNMYGIMEPNKA